MTNPDSPMNEKMSYCWGEFRAAGPANLSHKAATLAGAGDDALHNQLTLLSEQLQTAGDMPPDLLRRIRECLFWAGEFRGSCSGEIAQLLGRLRHLHNPEPETTAAARAAP